jgi:hypothetical protein
MDIPNEFLGVYYIPKMVKKTIEVEELERVEYDKRSMPDDYYNYNYQSKDNKMIRRPKGGYDLWLQNNKPQKQTGRWQTAHSSDRIWGGQGNEVNGIKSQADGRYYESKSAYYKSLRERGLEVATSDTVSKPATKEIDWKQAVGETLQQLK